MKKTVLLLCLASVCYGASITIPGQAELVVYNFDGSTAVSFGPDFSAFAQDQRLQLAADPTLELPRYGIYSCEYGCPDFTGIHFDAYGPGLTTPPQQGTSETPEPSTWLLALGMFACFGVVKAVRRRFAL
jgi:hypothetical protein